MVIFKQHLIGQALVCVLVFFMNLMTTPSLAGVLTIGAEEFHPWDAGRTRNCGGWGQYCSLAGGSGFMVASIRLPQNPSIQIRHVRCHYLDNDTHHDLVFHIRHNFRNLRGTPPGHAAPSVRSSGQSPGIRQINLQLGSTYSLREDTSYKIFVYMPAATRNLRIYNCKIDVYDFTGSY